MGDYRLQAFPRVGATRVLKTWKESGNGSWN
jgi:hypothetical protein